MLEKTLQIGQFSRSGDPVVPGNDIFLWFDFYLVRRNSILKAVIFFIVNKSKNTQKLATKHSGMYQFSQIAEFHMPISPPTPFSV